ncbi:MAG: L-glutamate gamma-semialdehyde dehydrogenase [Candidatus Nanopelagicales bacterium]|nr:L-glutamate gamma-semialdehyde dehydrogenase [Candidatus Nanopelagicales bacterium]MDZ4249943.1 L-glutamate gamma-semialdehyde dehydrogenase [Candidatus Nanopelagicales bacterium]
MDAVTNTPKPVNEPIGDYEPGSAQRDTLRSRLDELASQTPIDLPSFINGEWTEASGEPFDVVQPHDHADVLGVARAALRVDVDKAISSAHDAAPGWRDMSFDDRAAVILKAADLLAGPRRATLNAATMLGQSKTCYQAEIDAACELIDFWRFNVHFARQIMAEQPTSSPGVWNRSDYRPLEGFVYAITPFNFTAIAGNLPTAPALMGNTVVWKPASTQLYAAHFLMEVLAEAGLPPGVINMVTGAGAPVSDAVLADPGLAGIHFTGSTAVFQSLWQTVGENISNYHAYPRIVGETGGKDFVLAHPSADPGVLTTALIRGAFEYQGQKCSAASRAYIPRSVWDRMGSEFADLVDSLPMGSPLDFGNFLSAVIDAKSFESLSRLQGQVRRDDKVRIVSGGGSDDSTGYFVRPTVLLCSDPEREYFKNEYFGPILTVHVFDDSDYDRVVTQMESVSSYALTGSIIASDRRAIADAASRLRFAAGNFYINDKPTGAVVGQQPFGGARASGTNDKAGAPLNLLRWVSARSIKETFVPPVDYRYPHMG